MENRPVLLTAMNFGAMSGLGSFLIFLLIYWTGTSPLGPASWLGSWIPVVFMVYATINYRDKESGGTLSYWRSFRVGFLTAACGGFLFALLVYVFGMVIDPDMVDHFKQESLKYLQQTEDLSKSVFGEEIYDSSVENIEKLTLANICSQEFMNKTLGGLLTAFVTAAILKKSSSTPIV